MAYILTIDFISIAVANRQCSNHQKGMFDSQNRLSTRFVWSISCILHSRMWTYFVVVFVIIVESVYLYLRSTHIRISLRYIFFFDQQSKVNFSDQISISVHSLTINRYTVSQPIQYTRPIPLYVTVQFLMLHTNVL